MAKRITLSISPGITRGGRGNIWWLTRANQRQIEEWGLGYFPWQRLYFLPLPQGHFSLRPILWSASWTIWRFSSQSAQVQALGCSEYQLGLTMGYSSLLLARRSRMTGLTTMLNTIYQKVKGPRTNNGVNSYNCWNPCGGVVAGMSKLISGERVGKNAVLAPGASVIIFDEDRKEVLLTRRSDNGRWCLPGGGMEPGESASETGVREAQEETGLDVRVTKLVGVYTSPDIMIEYADGNRVQPVAFSFEAEIIGGVLGLSDETTEFGYFGIGELDRLDLMEHHHQRILDAAENREDPFVS